MWDITFCSKKECKNLKCERNQNNYNFMEAGNHPISIGEFRKCEYWNEIILIRRIHEKNYIKSI